MNNNIDIFDKIMSVRYLNKFEKIYKKNKEVLLYLFFGGLTTFISIALFFIANTLFQINVLIANIISWIFAVTFSYITNRIWVFNSKAKGKHIIKEFISFYIGRLTSLGTEELILFIFVTVLNLNSLLIKVIAQIVVLIMNYFISKILIFRKGATKNGDN